jgi:hypothetical protein
MASYIYKIVRMIRNIKITNFRKGMTRENY